MKQEGRKQKNRKKKKIMGQFFFPPSILPPSKTSRPGNINFCFCFILLILWREIEHLYFNWTSWISHHPRNQMIQVSERGEEKTRQTGLLLKIFDTHFFFSDLSFFFFFFPSPILNLSLSCLFHPFTPSHLSLLYCILLPIISLSMTFFLTTKQKQFFLTPLMNPPSRMPSVTVSRIVVTCTHGSAMY